MTPAPDRRGPRPPREQTFTRLSEIQVPLGRERPIPAAFDLSGRVSVITGAGSPDGIGFTTARILAELGPAPRSGRWGCREAVQGSPGECQRVPFIVGAPSLLRVRHRGPDSVGLQRYPGGSYRRTGMAWRATARSSALPGWLRSLRGEPPPRRRGWFGPGDPGLTEGQTDDRAARPRAHSASASARPGGLRVLRATLTRSREFRGRGTVRRRPAGPGGGFRRSGGRLCPS
jgi:hypothetical protein